MMLNCVNCTHCHRVCVCVCVCAHTYLFEYVHVFSFCLLCFRYINERENTIVMEGCMLMNKSPTVMCSAKKKRRKKYLSGSLCEKQNLFCLSQCQRSLPCEGSVFCFISSLSVVVFVLLLFFVFGVIEGIFHKLAKVTFVFFIHFLRD